MFGHLLRWVIIIIMIINRQLLRCLKVVSGDKAKVVAEEEDELKWN